MDIRGWVQIAPTPGGKSYLRVGSNRAYRVKEKEYLVLSITLTAVLEN